MIDSNAITSLLISNLSTDSAILAAFPGLVTNGAAQILDDDPLGVEQTPGMSLSVFVCMEDIADSTLGGSNGGKFTNAITLGCCIYVYEQNFTPGLKQQLVSMSSELRRSLMRYRIGHSAGVQYWSMSKFRSTSQGTTGYYRSPGKFRRSVTFIDLYSTQYYD